MKNIINKTEEIDYLKGIDIIYWINLETSVDRKNNIIKMFENKVFENIKKERINGINGNNVDLCKYIEDYDEELMSKSEYGCLLSHLDAINTFSKSDNNIALILEDDCTLEFKKYWNDKIENIIKNAPSDWEVLHLSYTNWNENYKIHKWNNDDKYIDTMNYGTLSYLINKNAALKLINNFYTENKKYKIFKYDKKHYPSDKFIYKFLKTYFYKYPFFIYKTDNDSTIHTNHLSFHEKSKNIIINNYEKKKNKNIVPNKNNKNSVPNKFNKNSVPNKFNKNIVPNKFNKNSVPNKFNKNIVPNKFNKNIISEKNNKNIIFEKF